MAQQQHLATLIRKHTTQLGERTALLFSEPSANAAGWQSISWQQFGEHIDACAKALLAAGVAPQQTVGIWSRNKPEWTIADLAIMTLRGVSVPLYATNTASQSLYVIEDAKCQLLFVGEQAQYDLALQVLEQSTSLKQIVVFDSSVDLRGCPQACHFEDFLRQGDAVDQAEVDQRLSQA